MTVNLFTNRPEGQAYEKSKKIFKRNYSAWEPRVVNSLQAPLVQLRERHMFLGMKNNPFNQSMEETDPLNQKSVNSKAGMVSDRCKL